MKTLLYMILLGFAMYASCSDAQESSEMSATMKHAVRYGADAMVTLHVVDSQTKPVSNLTVEVFTHAHYESKGERVEATTDGNGNALIACRTTGILRFSVYGNNYYRSSEEYAFLKSYDDWVEDGKWQPWNPTLPIGIKEKRHPIPMEVKKIFSKMPAQDVAVGFDFKVGDWVAPYGAGVSGDIFLTYRNQKKESATWRRHDFIVEFPSAGGGYLRNKDSFSEFVSDYEARTNGYASRFTYDYERTQDEVIHETNLDSSQYLVFRTRTETNILGSVVRANYGKIYGPFQFAMGPEKLISFLYFFNPTPNDRNLEYDGNTNLLDPMERIPIP